MTLRRGRRPDRRRGAARRRARRRGGRRRTRRTPGTRTSWWGCGPSASTGRVLGEVVGLEHLPGARRARRARAGRRAHPRARSSRAIVPVVDVAGGRVVLDPPGGLLASDAANLVVLRGDGDDRDGADDDVTCGSTSSRSSPSTSRRWTCRSSARRATPGLLDLRVHDLRDWTTDRHRTVDDTPFGGGAGMVMRPDVWGEALDDAARRPDGARCWCRRRRGSRSRSATAEALAGERAPRASRAGGTRGSTRGSPSTTGRADAGSTRVLARRLRAQRRRGRRARHRRGRRPPAARRARQPGVAGRGVARRGGPARVPRLHQAARAGAGLEVPEVLLSGHHARIARWRRDQRAGADGAPRRPDLLAALDPATRWTGTTAAAARDARLGGRSTDDLRAGERLDCVPSDAALWQTGPLVRAGRVSATGETTHDHPGPRARTHRTTRPGRRPALHGSRDATRRRA